MKLRYIEHEQRNHFFLFMCNASLEINYTVRTKLIKTILFLINSKVILP